MTEDNNLLQLQDAQVKVGRCKCFAIGNYTYL